jgi:hypothetical protein
MSADIASVTIEKLRREICELQHQNAALRAASVEACALARVWVTIWHDKLSDESVQLFTQLEKRILKEAQP